MTMLELRMLRGEICDTFTALLGFLALADSDHAHPDRREKYMDEASHQAVRLRVLSGGDLLLVVSKDQTKLLDQLRAVFGDGPGVEIIMDRRRGEPDTARRDERRRHDITDDLQRVGVGIGRPHLRVGNELHATTRSE
jgi:hypothetical protein